MEKLIRKIQQDWIKAKAMAQAQSELNGFHELAYKLGACSMFKGDENLQELIRLMFTPQGMEFMTRFGFPSLSTFRKFKKYNPEQFGVYIDKGNIELCETRKVFLVGNTSAVLKYRETAGNRVCIMHGASAVIIAGGYAVIKTEKDSTAQLSTIVNDKAIVR